MIRRCHCCRRELADDDDTVDGFCLPCLDRIGSPVDPSEYDYTPAERVAVALIAITILAIVAGALFFALRASP